MYGFFGYVYPDGRMQVAVATFRRNTMPKAKKANHPAPATDAAPEHSPAVTTAGEGSTAAQEPPAGQPAAEQRTYAADPDPKLTASLSGTKGGPVIHLLRSHKFKQMQIRVDGEQLEDKYVKMIEDLGWKNRTRTEGIFTKQIDHDARWQSVRKMEDEFREVANKIRADRNLAPTLELVA
jgi:hypothetical protein